MGWKPKKLSSTPKKPGGLVGETMGKVDSSVSREAKKGAGSANKNLLESQKNPKKHFTTQRDKAKSGVQTMGGNDPANKRVAPGAPGVPYVEGATPAAGGKEYNPFPFDYAKRDQTIDPATGMVKDQYKMNVMKERAESPWLKQKLAQQATQEGFAKDDANKNAAMNQANAQSGLAQTSGASAGAMERMQSASGRDALMAQQRVGQQGMQQRQDLSLQDTDRQIGAEQTNIGTSLSQIDQKYGGDKDVWSQMAGGYAADQMAQGIAKQKPTDSWQVGMDARDRWKGFDPNKKEAAVPGAHLGNLNK